MLQFKNILIKIASIPNGIADRVIRSDKMKTTYTASFDNGEVITRKSDNEYKFAWCVTYVFDESVKLNANASYIIENYKNGSFAFITGFSKTMQNAVKAANNSQSHYFLKRVGSQIVETK